MASLISLRSLAPSLSLFLFLLSFSKAEDGRSLYLKHCAECHHESRIGRTAPPLIPEFLKRKKDSYLFKLIRDGLPGSSMPSFGFLSREEIEKIIKYIKSPAKNVRYTFGDIKRSHQRLDKEGKNLSVKDIRNLVVVVEKGAGKVWLVEGKRILDKFDFKNVHGGVKFSPDGSKFYVPARDGWIISYNINEGKPEAKVRACVYLRNIAVSPEGNRIVASCVLPKSLVLFDTDLKPLKRIELKGRPGAVYELVKRSTFILTFRDKSLVAFLDPDGNIIYKNIDEPLEDFFIDPFERYLIGSSRRDKKLVVYEIDTLKKVFEKEVAGLPHLFSSAFWYSKGNFYFATRHIGSTEVSIWSMYDWKLIKKIDTNGKGFFVRTHPAVPYLWVDNGNNSFVLIDKRTLQLSKVITGKDSTATHVEFSGDGKYAYISVVGKEGKLLIYDPLNLSLIRSFPADHPAGKYNFVMKSRRFYPSLLGQEVFMAKCWGCHHQTEEAFGPSFKWIAEHRSKDLIVSQIVNPEETSKLLGYKRNAMPRIKMSTQEIEAILSLMDILKEERTAKYAKGK